MNSHAGVWSKITYLPHRAYIILQARSPWTPATYTKLTSKLCQPVLVRVLSFAVPGPASVFVHCFVYRESSDNDILWNLDIMFVRVCLLYKRERVCDICLFLLCPPPPPLIPDVATRPQFVEYYICNINLLCARLMLLWSFIIIWLHLICVLLYVYQCSEQ